MNKRTTLSVYCTKDGQIVIKSEIDDRIKTWAVKNESVAKCLIDEMMMSRISKKLSMDYDSLASAIDCMVSPRSIN